MWPGGGILDCRQEFEMTCFLAMPAWLLFLLVAAASAAAPSLLQLEGILDRAMTMMGAFIGDGVPFTPGFSDNLLLLQQVPSHPSSPGFSIFCSNYPPVAPSAISPMLQVGAAFAGRVAYVNETVLAFTLTSFATGMSGDQRLPSLSALPRSLLTPPSPSRRCPSSSSKLASLKLSRSK